MSHLCKQAKIAVIFGGNSTEYEVSLQSAHAVITHIDKDRYTPVPIGITREGKWYLYSGDYSKIPSDEWYSGDDCTPVVISPDKTLHGIIIIHEPQKEYQIIFEDIHLTDQIKHNTLEHISLDAAIPVLHGKNGEDGTVQGALELAGITVIGCGTLCSALCMDKDMAHRMVSSAGIKVPRSFILQNPFQLEYVIEIGQLLGYPLFVKPVRSGSSFGITKVKNQDELLPAIMTAFEHDSKVILEKCIEGFEVGCAVLGRNHALKSGSFDIFNGNDPSSEDRLIIGAVDEIELSDGFFDYVEKYNLNTSTIHVPARITPEKETEIKDTACRIFQILGCDYFSRIDFFLTPTGDIYFNEVNTIPGFTVHSRFPGMLKAAGFSFDTIIQRLIEMGVEVRE